MTADRFLKMVENLEDWKNGFNIITTGRNIYKCLGEGKFSLDEPNHFIFILGDLNQVSTVVDLLAVEAVDQTAHQTIRRRPALANRH